MVQSGYSLPSDPHLRRWMLFVDGENFTLRAQKVAERAGVKLTEGKHYVRDVFIWLPGLMATQDTTQGYLRLQPHATRSHYYTSLTGDEPKMNDVRKRLRDLAFSPQVFKKSRDKGKGKGVDIALSKDLLVNAFHDSYDVAVLIAGDGDYVPLVEEVKRLGKVVYLVFFEEEGLNQDLWMAADSYFEMKPFFLDCWKKDLSQENRAMPARENQ
jgi:uncharacterized LabA/DUF88 family protein